MMKRAIPGRALVAALILLLQACGGGGGSDNPTPPTPEPTTYTLSGAVQPATGTAVDSDTNDPDAPYATNDSAASAQPIPNPVTLGGYVNQAGSGPSGRSRDSGDPVDMFRTQLFAGQQINLLIAAANVRNDLDLGLADLNGTLIDASLGSGRVKSLLVPANGEYLVVVRATQGASNYTLTLGQPLTGSTVSAARLSEAFVPGDVVLRFQDSPILPRGGLRAQAQAAGLSARSQNETTERNRLFTTDTLRMLSVAIPTDATEFAPGIAFADDAQRDKFTTLELVRTLSTDPDVVTASPNYLRQPLFVPNDPLYRFQWHYPQLNLPQAWDLSSGSGVIVAVIDTGVVLSHPDLQGQLVEGYDFIKQPSNALDGDGIDPDPSDPGDQSNPDGSSSFHGTHVTGTVVAATDNALGVAGVAFGAKVMPLRAVGRFGGTLYDIEQAVRFAAGLPNDSGTVPARHADIINLSLGSTSSAASEQAVYDQARAVGVIVVAAAGNDGNSTPFYPAAYPGVVGVSAVTITKTLAPYSNFGAAVDLAAPGGNTATDVNGDGKPDGVLSTVANDSSGVVINDYVIWQGTSMATPHAAGVIALMKALAPNMTPAQFDALLASGAITEDLGSSGRDDQFGYGLLNASQAVVRAAAIGGNPVDPVPVLGVSPAALNFGLQLGSQNLTVLNAGGGTLQIGTLSEDSGGWLRITPAQVQANGTGIYTVTVSRTGLADGLYKAMITVPSNANTVRVQVIMQVANNLGAGNVGQQYIVLVDASTGESVDSVPTIRQADGRYTYTLSGVAAGTYWIYSGSDFNNNLQICDTGESCGAYLTTDEPVAVVVDRDRSNLDFGVSYTVNLAEFQSATASDADNGIARRASPMSGIAR